MLETTVPPDPRRFNTTGPGDSNGRCGIRISGLTTRTGSVPPQHEGVLDRLAVVGGPDAGEGEAEPLVEAACRLVRPPDLQRRADGPLGRRLLQHERQQRAGDTAPAPGRI